MSLKIPRRLLGTRLTDKATRQASGVAKESLFPGRGHEA